MRHSASAAYRGPSLIVVCACMLSQIHMSPSRPLRPFSKKAPDPPRPFPHQSRESHPSEALHLARLPKTCPYDGRRKRASQITVIVSFVVTRVIVNARRSSSCTRHISYSVSLQSESLNLLETSDRTTDSRKRLVLGDTVCVCVPGAGADLNSKRINLSTRSARATPQLSNKRG